MYKDRQKYLNAQLKYNEAHREERRLLARNWRLKNKESKKEYDSKYYLKIKSSPDYKPRVYKSRKKVGNIFLQYTKNCLRCREEFSTYKSNKIYCSKRCKKCVIQRGVKIKQRLKAIEVLGNKCKHCGLDDADVLQFDHIIPVKVVGNREKTSALVKKIRKGEISNLQLLCANCHAKKTWRS